MEKIHINAISIALLTATLVVVAIISHPLIILLFLILIVFPGLLLSHLLLNLKLPFEERLMVSTAIGIAFIPFATYLFKIFSVPLTITTISLLIAIMSFAVLRTKPRFTFIITKKVNAFHLILIAILFLSLFTRLFPIMNLEVPLFADPALQGMASQLIVEQNGIPDTWSPYLSLSFQHQPGFASIVAWFSLFSTLSIPRIILFFTNIMHALLPLSLYLLAYAIFKNRTQGIIAALLGLIALFPTSLFVTGANSTIVMYALLPVILALAIIFLHNTNTNLRAHLKPIALFVLLFIGALLLHPTFLIFFILIAGPFVTYLFLSKKKFFQKHAYSLFSISIALLLSVIIVSPFFLNSAGNQGLLTEQWNIQADYINPERIISPYFLIEPLFFLFDNPQGAWFMYLENFSLFQFLSHAVGIGMTALFLYALFYIWKTKNRLGYFLITIYLIFITLSSIQSSLQFEFPGWTLLYPSRIKFLLILPVALILASLFSKLKVQNWRNILYLPLLLILLIIPHNLSDITKHLSSLSTLSPYSESDKNAMEWIEHNVPKEAVILNTIKDVETGVFIGGAGQWIPSLTGHNILFPPLSLTENVLSPDITNRLQVIKELATQQPLQESFLKILDSYNVQYVFLSPNMMHTRQELFPPIDPEQFLASPFFKLEFQDGNTYIFSVLYQTSGL